MVDVVPFSGLLYNCSQSGELSRVIAPPYDVISSEMQDALYERHPHNVVRLILGKQFPDDTDRDNRYTRAAQDFQRWREENILKRDPSPSFYVYSQEYEFEGRSINRIGFFARVRLEDFSRGNICPHEFTLAKAKKDRAQLIRACKANFSPVFGLYSDPSGQMDARLRSAMQTQPIAEVVEDNVVNRMWRITDADTLDFLSAQMIDKKITLADGHHRYETALDYFKEQGKDVPDAAWILMFLTNLEAEGLAIYPTHRQVKLPANWSRNEFEQRLGEFFEITPQPKDSSTADLLTTLKKAGQPGTAYCIYFGKGEAALLCLKDPVLADPLREEDEPEDLLNLDVYQLHTVILKHLLGINTRTPEGQACMQYKVQADQARQDVDSGKQDLAFFMNATPIEQVREIAEKGIRLPQKATYFYPKLLSGLVINPFES